MTYVFIIAMVILMIFIIFFSAKYTFKEKRTTQFYIVSAILTGLLFSLPFNIMMYKISSERCIKKYQGRLKTELWAGNCTYVDPDGFRVVLKDD